MNSYQSNTNVWLVVHIPKAAGTSFRWSLERYFGQSKVIRDYGPDAEATSGLVREHLYSDGSSNRLEELMKAIMNGTSRVLIGHFPLKKYANFFEPERIITFVRDPLVRTCSEYLHRVGNRTFEGSLLEFIQKPGFQNQQARLLEGMPLNSFIGISEKYGESLKRINYANQWKLSTLKKNVGRHGGGKKLAESLSAQELELFHKKNKKDLDFYRESVKKFDAAETPHSDSPGIFNWLRRK